MGNPNLSAILVVDDDAAVCWAMQRTLEAAGQRVVVAADAAAARRRLKSDIALMITDIRMQGESGLDLLAWAKQTHGSIPVVVMTAHGTVETAMEAVGRGAFDYLPKPIDRDRLLATVRRALGEAPLAAAARPGSFDESGIVGSSPVMQEVYRRLAAAAASEVEVLFTGPAGSGKETLARALHRYSSRRSRPFISIPAGMVGEDLEARLAAAGEGVLFLDEVDELPAAAQVALAAHLVKPHSVRLIAATRRDLGGQVEAGAFREDLAWRLRSVAVAVPPLAQHMEDLPELVRAFLMRAAARLGRPVAITDAALALLGRHAWPGNVRELKHVLEEAAVIATGGVIDSDHLTLPGSLPPPVSLDVAVEALAQRLMDEHPGDVHARVLEQVEAVLVRVAIARTEGNQLRAAELIGINRATLKKRLDQSAAHP